MWQCGNCGESVAENFEVCWNCGGDRGETPDPNFRPVYGYRDLHFAWYRIHIHLRPGTRNLTVGTMNVAGNYEVYANGVRLGGSGKMTERLLSVQYSLASYAVPDHLIGERGDLVLAIRCVVNWGSSGGHGASTPLNSSSVYLFGQNSTPMIASWVACP